ncbi:MULTISPECIES: phosphosulfolactate synthase [unclassified Mesorhizobium]|uniref:phosphosulfolactate synthase n=1 Tax=unclassified Mesorhizobium TaxID=325217 RepID=UPI0019D46E3C|nr:MULTISPECIES: phosphosulfolactate synthase [unclassified Mesorhizobium]
MTDTAFSFIPRAARSPKPRKTGLTEIRGPYYSAYGPRHLADLVEIMGNWIAGSGETARIINELGLEKVMFEAADPAVFEWYIKNYGNEINLFVDQPDRAA